MSSLTPSLVGSQRSSFLVGLTCPLACGRLSSHGVLPRPWQRGLRSPVPSAGPRPVQIFVRNPLAKISSVALFDGAAHYLTRLLRKHLRRAGHFARPWEKTMSRARPVLRPWGMTVLEGDGQRPNGLHSGSHVPCWGSTWHLGVGGSQQGHGAQGFPGRRPLSQMPERE